MFYMSIYRSRMVIYQKKRDMGSMMLDDRHDRVVRKHVLFNENNQDFHVRKKLLLLGL